MDYPLQCYAVKRQKQVLSIETHLYPPSEEGSDNPLESPGFSRFRLTILDKSGDKIIYPFANIPERDVSAISKAADAAYYKKLTYDSEQALRQEDAGGSPAYTARFHLGNNKGKSPAEILLDAPEKRSVLLKDREYLSERVGTYPANQAIVDGIDDAIALLDAGKLTRAEQTEKAPVIVIYEQKFKYLASMKDNEGRCKVYSIRMHCDLSRKYPFYVEVENAMGFVKKTATGASNVEMSTLINKEKTAMNLTDGEFIGMVSTMDTSCKAFQYEGFARQYKKAQDLANQARLKGKPDAS